MTPADIIRTQATAEHKAAARDLATFLVHFNAEALTALADGLRRTLCDRERVCVAIAALMAVERTDLPEVLQILPEPPAGWPDAPFTRDDLMGDSALWAASAWPEERRAYAMAALAHMTEEERHALVRHLDQRRAA